MGDLNARLQLTGSGLRAMALPKLVPAALDLDLRLIQDQLSLKGTLTQPAIQPIEIAGTLPLSLKQIIQKADFDEQSPLQLSVRLPRSSVAFLEDATPLVRFVEGTAALSVDVDGTVAEPRFSGSAQIDLSAIRFTKANLPGVSDIHARARFVENRLIIEQGGANLSGGTVSLTGEVRFPKLTEPQLDLRFGLNMRCSSATKHYGCGPLSGSPASWGPCHWR